MRRVHRRMTKRPKPIQINVAAIARNESISAFLRFVAIWKIRASGLTLWIRTRTIHRRRKYLLQRSTSGVRVREQAAHFSRIRSSIRRQSPPVRPRNVRFVLCAIAERTIATRSPAARSPDRRSAGTAIYWSRTTLGTHGAPAAILRLHRYDYVSIDAEVTESKNAHTMHARRLRPIEHSLDSLSKPDPRLLPRRHRRPPRLEATRRTERKQT